MCVWGGDASHPGGATMGAWRGWPPGKAICQGESAVPLSAIVECGGRLMRARRFLQGPDDAADGSGRRPGLLSVM